MRFDEISALQRSMRNINLRALRERAGLTQKEVAAELGVDASTVSKWESNPATCTAEQINAFLDAIGHLEIVTPPLDIDPIYNGVESIQSVLMKEAALLPPVPQKIGDLATALEDSFRAPRIAIGGSRNAGKSTFINSLIGAAILPAAYHPLTRTATLLRHDSRRKPDHIGNSCYVYMKESDLDDVLFGKNCEHSEAGGIEILDEYVAHRADRVDLKSVPVVVLVYLDAPILNACDLIDLPGLNESTEDTEVAHKVLTSGLYGPRADAVLFCSPVDQFCLQTERIVFATWRNVATLNRENFWFVATRAKELNLAMERAVERILTGLPWSLNGTQGLEEASTQASYNGNRSAEEIKKAWFPFYQPSAGELKRKVIDEYKAHTRAHRAVRDILYSETAPIKIQSFYTHVRTIWRTARENLDRLISDYDQALSNSDAGKARLGATKEWRLRVQAACTKTREFLSAGYIAERQRAISAATHLMDAYEDHSVINKIISNNFAPNEKDDGIKNAPALITSSLQNDVALLVSTHITSVRTEISKHLADVIAEGAKIDNIEVSIGQFSWNVQQSLIQGGAAALMYFGGHSIILPTVGAVVGGIGTAAASWTGIAAFASLGPIAVAIGGAALAIAAGVLAIKAVVKFWEGWRVSLAKDIAKEIMKSGVRKKVISAVIAAFDDEKDAWLAAMGKIQEEADRKIEELERVIESRDHALEGLDRLKKFKVEFEAMSWPIEVRS